MSHEEILASTVARLTEHYREDQRVKAQARLVGALRTIPPNLRDAEVDAALKRLAKQEVLEAKIKALSNEDIDKLDI